jgi:hypothetical protein
MAYDRPNQWAPTKDQYSQLGKDLWGASNSLYGQGWLDLGKYSPGGNSKYEFAYDDSANIGQKDNDPYRYLYVRSKGDPSQTQRYRLGSTENQNIDYSSLGQQVSQNNWLNDFWGNYYGWQTQQQQNAQQPVIQPDVPVQSPGGVRPDQGVTEVPGGVRFPGLAPGEYGTAEDVTSWGLGTAKKIFNDSLGNPQYYPGWWGEGYQTLDAEKWANAFPQFLDVPQYSGIDLPPTAYQGIDPSRYAEYQKVAAQPGYQPIGEGALPGYEKVAARPDYQSIGEGDLPGYEKVATPGAYQGAKLAPESYSGLMGGDYQRLEESLRTPGEIAAQRAYDQGLRNLDEVMGASGLYGSSVMGRQMNDRLNQGLMDTLAANAAQAAAQRYGMQQGDTQFGANYALQRAAQDMADTQFGAGYDLQRAAQQIGQNQFGANLNLQQLAQQIQDQQFGSSYGLQRADLARQNALDQYGADMTARNLLNDYNNQRFMFDYGMGGAARNERNGLLQNRFQYDLAAQQWRNALNEQLMNQALALSGQGAPLTTANQSYQLQQQAYNDASQANKWGMGLWGLDKLFSSDWGQQAASGAWDWLKGRFK